MNDVNKVISQAADILMKGIKDGMALLIDEDKCGIVFGTREFIDRCMSANEEDSLVFIMYTNEVKPTKYELDADPEYEVDEPTVVTSLDRKGNNGGYLN